YYGDENRPSNGKPGGAIFKFVPTKAYLGGAPPSVSDSPLAGGNVFGPRLGRRSGNTDFGQGTETGLGTWIPLGAGPDLDLRAKAEPPPTGVGLTGFYRPEDLDVDLEAKKAGRVRFCGPMTGNETDAQLFGKVVCFSDGTLAQATANAAVPSAQDLVEGNPQFAMPDNIAYQPHGGYWIVHEDADTTYQGTGLGNHNNDLWSCLDDGRDDDLLTEGCIRIATLRDLDAEWTGGIFDATGDHFYVSIQHNSSGTGVILDITGWK
ncbi:MAG: alkaline phosphatase PhoX, partial [Acidimicrobiales bacterium]